MIEFTALQNKALKTWLASLTAHFIFFLLFLYVNLNHPSANNTTVEVNVYSAETKQDAMKETFLPNLEKPKPAQETIRDKKIPAPTEKQTTAPKAGTPGASGGSTAALGNNGADGQIKTGGSGEGYGIGNGGQGGKVEDPVFHVAVEIMPEPYGGISGIAAKVRLPEGKTVRGNAYILCFIDESGVVRRAQVTKGIAADVDGAVVAAVKRTRFKPGKDKGETKKVQMVLNIPIGD